VYSKFCASCHEAQASGAAKAGSVLDPAYLSLITNQGLRTIVITGRPDFNAPDWRNNIPGQPMTDQDISDVVAFLSSHRPAAAATVQAAIESAAGIPGGSQ
jgi:mono/diheme cytochrome c family protein